MRKLTLLISFSLLIVCSISAQQNDDFYAKAMEKFNNNDYSQAIDYFNQYTNLEETDEKFYSSSKFYIGECLLGLEQFDGAIAQFEYFVKQYPTSNLIDLALYRLGNIYFEKKIYDKSRHKLIQLVNQFPGSNYSGSAYHLIGETFIHENNLTQAERFFTSAANSKRNNSFVDHSLYSLANLYEKKGRYKEAVSNYDKILSFHRNSKLLSVAQLRIGICYFQLEDYDNAILELSDPLIDELSHDDRNSADYILANSFYRLKEYKDASNTYKKILENSPNEDMLAKIRYGLAWIYFQQGNYSNAYKLFNVLSNSKNDSIAIKSFYWSGEAKRYEGKYDEAIEIHKRFALKYPNHPLAERVRLNIGISKFSEKNLDESEQTLLKTINSADKITRARSLTLLGEINLKKKNYNKASEYFKKGLSIKQIPLELKDRCNLGLGVSYFYQKNNIDAVKSFYAIDEKTTKIEKNKLNFYLAEANFFLGNYRDAISNYNKVKTDDLVINKNSIYGKAYSYFNLKDFNKAAHFFIEYIKNYEKDKKYFECELRLADSYYGSKSYGKAAKHYKEVLENGNYFNDDDRSYFNYAQALFKSGNATEAIKTLEKIQTDFPASSYTDDSQYLIGWIYFQQNEFDEAIINYKKIFENYPQSPTVPIVYYSIGDSYFNKGEYTDAIKSYEQLIKKYPNSSYVYDAVNGIQYCYIIEDKPKEAIKYLDRFINEHQDLNFLDKLQFKKGEIYYSGGKYQLAIREYSKLIDQFPQSSLIYNSYYWMGKSASLLEKLNDAISYFNLVIDKALNTEEGFNSILELGRIYRKQNNFNNEIELYDRVLPNIKNEKQTSEIIFVKAQSFIENNDIASAYENLNKIVDKRDGSLFFYKAEIELGILELARMKYESSLYLFTDVSKNRTDDIAAQAMYYTGLNYFEQEKIPEAITELIKVRSMYSSYDEWYSKSLMLLGDCYVKNGDKANASEMYKAVIKRHRRDILGKEAKQKLKEL